MLATKRDININGVTVAQTPAIVPSFSSKGFPEVAKIIESLSSIITESALVSAYDLSHGFIETPPHYPEYLILDSGGYECGKDMELSDIRSNNYEPAEWALDLLKVQLDKWSAPQPTLAVSYDHPKQRVSLNDQIARARELFENRNFGRELLIKPISNTSSRIDISEVLSHIYEFRDFDVIGFTEKELGFSIFDRMKKIAKVRMAMENAGIKIPIHIFGSLDTISTPLYFIAGADIFDGLTWLRYSYSNGEAVYQKNAAALKYGIHINDDDIDPKVWFDNYQAMVDLQFSMKRYLKEQTFEPFGRHAEFFKQAYGKLQAEI